MGFHKRNQIISRGPPSAGVSSIAINTPPAPASVAIPAPVSLPGIRPSPINGQPTTSTGTPSLDSLFAGHAGLPLGCSLLVEEPGTTDYGGALLRYYAAEGIVQGHAVTVVGFGEHWVRELPGVTGSAEATVRQSENLGRGERERMKIAWRYERLGAFGNGVGGSRAQSPIPTTSTAASPTPTAGIAGFKTPFCHTFDLTQRLSLPASTNLTFIPIPISKSANNPFPTILSRLSAHLAAHPKTPHRLIIPSLLHPALYPPTASAATSLLQFFHSLRSLLRSHRTLLTAMISLPTELYPRNTGLIRWAEILSDSVVELVPLPRRTAAKTPAVGDEEPQGLVKLWKLPVLGEKGGGVGATLGAGEDLAFLVTRRRFEIMAYSLPPADDDEAGAQGDEGRKTKVDLEF